MANRGAIGSQALAGIRAFDLADAKGQYCGKLLADLGADVIKVEPPGGDLTRNIGPFFQDEHLAEKSLFWFRFNTNKRSITLNLEHPEGRKILTRLIARTDIVIETYPPGYLDERGMGYLAMKEINRGLILTSITAFGQSGPWKNYKASDIVALALGGDLYPCGWPDLPPLTIAGSQAYHQVSSQAASATLIALFHRLRTGEGQHIDVSMQQSMPVNLQASTLVYENTGAIRKRVGNELLQQAQSVPPAAQGIFPCKDGYIDIAQLSGITWWERFVEWLDAEGADGDLKEEKWQDPFFRSEPASVKHINDILGAFLRTRTKEEIFKSGQKRRVVIGPVNTPEDIAKDPYLLARSFFIPVDHEELGVTLPYIGPPYKLSGTPLAITRRAPLIGEHNSDIFEKELGITKKELIELKGAGVT